MNRSTNKPPMICLYRGRDRAGFVFARGAKGEERPIGFDHAAAAAILNQKAVGAP
jgi:hypothetical protein